MTRTVPVVPTSSGEGVILNPSPKTINPAKNWCLTWNNYPDNWKEIIVPVFQKYSQGYVIGEEVGESGTPHLQGYVESKDKKKIRPFTEFKLPKETSWFSAKGTRQQNIDYCTKDEKYISWGTCLVKEKYTINITLYEWQEEIVELLKHPPNDRSIFWFWEPDGCAGKTTFQKWIFLHYPNVAVLCGKATDMKNGIVSFQEKNERLPEIVLINIPRCQDTDHISWQGIEEIKDMFFFSGKYEGGMVCGPNPHVFIFSNQEPPIHKLSNDRWFIRDISK